MRQPRKRVIELAEPRRHTGPDRLDVLLGAISERWREYDPPYTEEREHRLQQLVSTVRAWKAERWVGLRQEPIARRNETLALLLAKREKVRYRRDDDPWLDLCTWLLPRIFPSLYDGATLDQADALARMYEIGARPPWRWKTLAERLVVDFDLYFRRRPFDPVELLPPEYDPIRLTLARLNGTGSSSYRSRANDPGRNPLAPFIWDRQTGIPIGDTLAEIIAETCLEFADHDR